MGAETLLTLVTGRLPIYLASVTPEPELKHILAERGLAGWFKGRMAADEAERSSGRADEGSRKPRRGAVDSAIAGHQRAASETGVRFLGRNSGLEFDSPPPTAFADLNEIAIYLKGSIA